jgi:hypothetical protein
MYYLLATLAPPDCGATLCLDGCDSVTLSMGLQSSLFIKSLEASIEGQAVFLMLRFVDNAAAKQTCRLKGTQLSRSPEFSRLTDREAHESAAPS